MTVLDTLSQKLATQLEATHVDIVDNSWQHAGHVAMADRDRLEATHLEMIVVSPRFEELNLLTRHRLVHETLKDAFVNHLHALSLKVYTPLEWQARQEEQR